MTRQDCVIVTNWSLTPLICSQYTLFPCKGTSCTYAGLTTSRRLLISLMTHYSMNIHDNLKGPKYKCPCQLLDFKMYFLWISGYQESSPNPAHSCHCCHIRPYQLQNIGKQHLTQLWIMKLVFELGIRYWYNRYNFIRPVQNILLEKNS